MQTSRKYIFSGGIFALISVALGAFGAHALKDRLITSETLDVWKTAVNYQMWHAMALILYGILHNKTQSYLQSAFLFGVGILLFSGSLYSLALDGLRWLGPITPLGGLCFIAGWSLLIITQLKYSKHSCDEY